MNNPKKAILLIALVFLFQGLTAQCIPDRHNTSSQTTWVSCTPMANPNTNRPAGHWIMYDLNYSYALEQTHFWNYNHPDTLSRGANNVVIDLSDDGTNWQEVANLNVPVASGSSQYEGWAGPHLGGQRARYILITLLSNHGDACYSLGEFRVGVQDEIDCLTEYLLSGDLTTRRYEAMERIVSDGQLINGAILQFEAGEEVVFDPDFTVIAGSEMNVVMQGCENN
jgi:hypothetical protein